MLILFVKCVFLILLVIGIGVIYYGLCRRWNAEYLLRNHEQPDRKTAAAAYIKIAFEMIAVIVFLALIVRCLGK